MFIKGDGKQFQGKPGMKETSTKEGKASNVQATGTKGTTLNQNSKWQGTTLKSMARG